MSDQPVAGAKRRDYWWTVLFTDPIAVPLVRLLARSGKVTPDQVSYLAILLGLAVGPLFALGTRAGLIAGAITFYFAFVVDCIDGKLARALGTSSEKGAALDQIGDAARRGSASLGILIGLYSSDPYEGYLAWAIVYVVLAYIFFELSGAEAPAEKTRGQFDIGSASAWTRWCARRRLLPTPGMPDAQAIVFVVGPLTTLFPMTFGVGILLASAGLTINAARRLR